VVAAVFGTIVAMLAYRIEATKAAIREQLAAVQEAIPSGETIDAPTPPPRGKPRWERETSSSPLDTSPTVVLTLESEAAIDGAFGKTVYPHLVLRCQKRQTEAYVNARVALTSQVRSWTSDYSWGSSTAKLHPLASRRGQARFRLVAGERRLRSCVCPAAG